MMKRRSCRHSVKVAILSSCIIAFGFAFVSTGAAAQGAQAVPARNGTVAPKPSERPTKLQSIVVTGTRAFSRSAAESLAPIDIISSQELEATGASNVNAALRMLLPAVNFAQPSNVDGDEAVQTIQLRGLSPDQVLVLINGKRQHTTSISNIDRKTYSSGSSAFDFNSIPLNAVKRIEVLRNGAAAQYGSDAIAGVVNIILKGGAKHGSVAVTGGQYFAGDGRTGQVSASGGLHLGKRGWVRLSVNYTHKDETNRAGADLRYPGDPTYATPTFHWGQPERRKKQAALNLQYNLSSHMQLYGFYIYSKRDPVAFGYFRSLSQYKGHPAAIAVYPRGYLPVERRGMIDDTETLGVRGTAWNSWHYDVSLNGGGNRVKSHITNSFNYDLGVNSPTRFYTGSQSLRDKVIANADFNKSFSPNWLSNPLTVSWGLSYRDVVYITKSGEPDSYFGTGSQGLTGSPPIDSVNKTRHNTAAYLQLESDVTAKLTASVAGRYEHYSDFGKTIPWKVSGRYQFNDLFALRGTVSTGFRAPSLQEMWSTGLGNDAILDPVTNTLVLVRSGTFPASSSVARALGGRPLQAEKSRSYSFGMVLTAANGLLTTLDLYQIEIRDRIIPSEALTGPAVAAYLATVGIPNVDGASFFNNAASTRTRGAGLVMTYPVYLANGGTLKFIGGFNYNKTVITHVEPNPPQLALIGLVLPVFGSSDRANLTIRTPKTKSTLSMIWQGTGHWSATARLVRYGSWKAGQTDNSAAQTYGGIVVFSASASYSVNRWKFTLGANNLNDAYPEHNNVGNDFDGNFPYPYTSPIGFSGGYVYGKIAYSW